MFDGNLLLNLYGRLSIVNESVQPFLNLGSCFQAFMVVHPTMWTKMTCWWFSTFMAPAIKNKIHNVRALQDLSALVDHKGLGMPMFITEQDMVFNGLRPFQP